MSWVPSIKPNNLGGRGSAQIGRQPVGFEQIRRSADLRGWYFGRTLAKTMSLPRQPGAPLAPAPGGEKTGALALFVFAVDAYRQRPDTYRADAIFEIFLPISTAAPQALNLLGLSLLGVAELTKLRNELNALLWKSGKDPSRGVIANMMNPAPPIRLPVAPFRSNAFDVFQQQALVGAAAGVAEFNTLVWQIIESGSSGFGYEAASMQGGWSMVKRLKTSGYDVVGLLGKEGQTAPGL